MALVRRSGSRFTANIWPGFVDAMTALLLVLMFVLSIFMIVQFVLRETVTVQDRELDQLSVEVATLAEALGLEQQRVATLEDEVGGLSEELADAARQERAQAALIASLTAAQDDALARIASFEEQVAGLLAQNNDLSGLLAASREEVAAREGDLTAAADEIVRLEAENARQIDQQEALQLALARARDEIDAQVEAARLAAAQREALEALIADLENDLATRETRLADLAGALAAAEDTAADQAGRIANLVQLLDERGAELAALRDAVEDQNATIEAAELARLEQLAAAEALRAQLADAEGALTAEEEARLAEAAAAEALRARLAEADAELTAMTLALEERRREAEETLTLLAAAEAARRTVETARADDLSRAERQRALLAQANATLAEQRGQTAEARREVALLNSQVAELRRQLASLQALLDASEARDAEAEVEIQNLTSRLNVALAQVAAEERRRAEELAAEAQDLRQARSEFFARTREILAGREGVRIVGDRFVFSSEVLFAPGSAELSAGGQAQVAQVADVLSEVIPEIPDGIEWILRVDGHTDNVPIVGSARFADNWELSQARALSVVRYMIEAEGLPAEHLSANGFGEYQPVDTADTNEARAANRRIELKFTER